MGGIECTSDKRDQFLWTIIERKLDNKDTPLDKKIHNEYLLLMGYNDYQFEESQNLKTAEIPNHVSERTRISRFKKWYNMAFVKGHKRFAKTNVHSNVTSVDLTPSSKNSSNTFMTPRYEPKLKFNFSTNLQKNNSNVIKNPTLNTVNYNTFTNQAIDIKERIELKEAKEKQNIKEVKELKEISFSKEVFNLKNVPTFQSAISPLPRSCSASNELNSSRTSNYAINQAEIGLRDFIKTNKSKFLERICKGPPESFRWVAWMIAADIDQERNEEFYFNLLNQEVNLQTDIQIKKDLNRTLTDEKLFSVDQTKSTLYNVLRAYANCDKEVSYCQGMNFIAAFLLIVSDFNEVDTNYMMMFLFMFNKSNLGIRGFFMNNFPLLGLYTYQFNYLFGKHFPALKSHFTELEIPNEMWISKWFQTLFTICLPLDVLVRLWDCIFAKGLDFLFNFAIALLRVFEPQLLKFTDISDISEYFKCLNPYLNNTKAVKIDVEPVIKDALAVKISKNLLNNLKQDYEKEFGVDLSFLNVNYDLKSLYTSTNSNKDNVELFENDCYNSNKLGLHQIKMDLKSKFKIKSEDVIPEEESKRPSIDVKLYQTNTNNIHILADGIDDDNCSEFEVFDADVISNVKTHTLNTKGFEENSKKKEMESKIKTINDI